MRIFRTVSSRRTNNFRGCSEINTDIGSTNLRRGISFPRPFAWGVAATLSFAFAALGSHSQFHGQEATSPPRDPAAARLEFEEAAQAWRDYLKELRTLNVRYQSAPAPEEMILRTQWENLLAKGRYEVVPNLRRAALAAYQTAPNSDPSISQLLINMLADFMERDAYEDALELGSALIASGHPSPDVFDHAGNAAFALHEFDLARQYWERARDAGVISEKARAMLLDLDNIQALWEQELAQREIDAEANLPRVKLVTTKGDIVLELFEDQAPGTVGNFIQLVEGGFYRDLLFHRVLPGFMAQTGCPKGDGSGGPGYQIFCEADRLDSRNHFRGSLSMAKSEPKHTGGSQFFLTFQPTPYLNGIHTVFGRVIEGIEVLERIQRRDPEQLDSREPDRVVEAIVLRKRPHEYIPNKSR